MLEPLAFKKGISLLTLVDEKITSLLGHDQYRIRGLGWGGKVRDICIMPRSSKVKRRQM